MPFALLRRLDADAESSRQGQYRQGRYLVELLPIHQVTSAAGYVALREASRQRDGSRRLEAFGDVRPGGASAATASCWPKPAGGLPPLPATRREVRGIVEAWGVDAMAHLADDASEDRVYTLPEETRFLHFATHGVLNERLPLDSAILLAAPRRGTGNGEDGVLHAWEVLERLRLDAELVTLSARDTGLGVLKPSHRAHHDECASLSVTGRRVSGIERRKPRQAGPRPCATDFGTTWRWHRACPDGDP